MQGSALVRYGEDQFPNKIKQLMEEVRFTKEKILDVNLKLRHE